MMGSKIRFVLHLGKMFCTNKDNSAVLHIAGE